MADKRKLAGNKVVEPAADKDKTAAIILQSGPTIRNLIYTVRGVQVMLDSDLAMLYDVETKVFNQAVQRNIKRFPEHFRFQLSQEEVKSLRSQIVTSHDVRESSRCGRHKLPYDHTEKVVAMLCQLVI